MPCFNSCNASQALAIMFTLHWIEFSSALYLLWDQNWNCQIFLVPGRSVKVIDRTDKAVTAAIKRNSDDSLIQARSQPLMPGGRSRISVRAYPAHPFGGNYSLPSPFVLFPNLSFLTPFPFYPSLPLSARKCLPPAARRSGERYSPVDSGAELEPQKHFCYILNQGGHVRGQPFGSFL